MNTKFAELRTEMNTKIGELRAEMDAKFAEIPVQLRDQKISLVKWMVSLVLAGIGINAAVVGIGLAVQAFF